MTKETKKTLSLLVVCVMIPLWGFAAAISFLWQFVCFGWFVGDKDFDSLMASAIGSKRIK